MQQRNSSVFVCGRRHGVRSRQVFVIATMCCSHPCRDCILLVKVKQEVKFSTAVYIHCLSHSGLRMRTGLLYLFFRPAQQLRRLLGRLSVHFCMIGCPVSRPVFAFFLSFFLRLFSKRASYLCTRTNLQQQLKLWFGAAWESFAKKANRKQSLEAEFKLGSLLDCFGFWGPKCSVNLYTPLSSVRPKR